MAVADSSRASRAWGSTGAGLATLSLGAQSDLSIAAPRTDAPNSRVLCSEISVERGWVALRDKVTIEFDARDGGVLTANGERLAEAWVTGGPSTTCEVLISRRPPESVSV